jgi:integrase
MPFTIFPHMLRHACGYALANAGHDTRALQAWLRHKNIQHTVRYTELAPDRFKNFLAIGRRAIPLNSEQFRSPPRTCGRFRGILGLR